MMVSAKSAKKGRSTSWQAFLKRFFDSSVLVPVLYADHPQHLSSTKLFVDAGKDDFCALRTLGEVYATLTGLPLRPRITGPEGISIVKQIRERLTLITLSEQEYVSALELASSDRKSTRLNSSHITISYAVFCLKKKKKTKNNT